MGLISPFSVRRRAEGGGLIFLADDFVLGVFFWSSFAENFAHFLCGVDDGDEFVLVRCVGDGDRG